LGRFLEHSRIFYFKNGGDEEYYLSSADWMSRNLHNRVELMFPIRDQKLKKSIKEILDIHLKDNTKAWELLPDKSYRKVTPAEGEIPFSSQDNFLNEVTFNTKNKRYRK
jgi:polyphosphate kinase